MTTPLPIMPRPIGAPQAPGRQVGGRNTSAEGFDQLLQQKIAAGRVNFSRHASERMQQRGITLDAGQTSRLQQAVSRLEAKGGRDSLVLLDSLALVVSVDNATVVTVTDQNQLKEHVFTNIDSAVIA